MGTTDILDRLTAAGIAISVCDDRLKLVPGSHVPPDLIHVIRERKCELVCTLLILREAELVALEAEARLAARDVERLKRSLVTMGHCA